MKLIIDADSIASDKLSGVGQYVNFLVQEIVRAGAEPKLLIPFNHVGGQSERKLRKLGGFTIGKTPYGRITNALSMANQPPQIDRIYGSGVYLFPNYKHFSISKRSRKIVAAHDLTYLKYPETMTERNQKFLARVVPRALKKADKIAVISHAVQNEILESYPWVDPHKFLYVPPAVNTKEYYPRSTKLTKEVKDKLQIKGSYFLFVSSIEPRKNLINMLDGFARSKAAESHSFVIVGGGGWKNEDIQSKVNQLRGRGIKIIKPERFVENDEVAALMSGATGLLSASLYEGFGMPIIEAQACKCPVITSNISSMPEAAGEGGALFVDPNSVQQMAGAIDDLASNADLRKQLIKQGHKNQQRFSWEKSARTILDAANSLASQ